MPRLSTSAPCPACHKAMVTRVMACPDCGLRIENDFQENEFAHLEEDVLHFLRVFIHCEGRIRDMEAALGVSYPTVKGRIAELKRRLGMTEAVTDDAGPASKDPVSDVLDRLESGEIDYEEAMRRINGEQ